MHKRSLGARVHLEHHRSEGDEPMVERLELINIMLIRFIWLNPINKSYYVIGLNVVTELVELSDKYK